jgi:hypothetical protein
MKKLLLLILIVFSGVPAFAIPNVWVYGTGQGWDEYHISNAQKQELWIACSPGYVAGQEVDNDIWLVQPGGELRELSFLIDGMAEYPLSMNTGTRSGANSWYSFTEAISKASSFDVYKNDTKVASFIATPQSVSQIISSLKDCKALGDKEKF